MPETRGLCLSEEQTVTTVRTFSLVFKINCFSYKDICILDQTSIISSTILPDLKVAKVWGRLPDYRHDN